ncbi:MAG TPA: hypothetical protein VNV13_00155 [Steroidobacteraceae bacterium]|nr:hypothetical protein [Steroidobacteraceae bacterium]
MQPCIFFNILKDQGCAGGSVAAGVLGEAGAGVFGAPGPAGAGTFVPSLLLDFGAGGAGMVRLCFCASGITSGPF